MADPEGSELTAQQPAEAGDDLDALWWESRRLLDVLTRETREIERRRQAVLAETRTLDERRAVLFDELTGALTAATALRADLAAFRSRSDRPLGTGQEAALLVEPPQAESQHAAAPPVPAPKEPAQAEPISTAWDAPAEQQSPELRSSAQGAPVVRSQGGAHGTLRLLAAIMLVLLLLVVALLLTPLPTVMGLHGPGTLSSSLPPLRLLPAR